MKFNLDDALDALDALVLSVLGERVFTRAVLRVLGRSDDKPLAVMSEIEPILPKLSKNALLCIDSDISAWLSGETAGDLKHMQEWTAFRNEVRSLLDKQ